MRRWAAARARAPSVRRPPMPAPRRRPPAPSAAPGDVETESVKNEELGTRSTGVAPPSSSPADALASALLSRVGLSGVLPPAELAAVAGVYFVQGMLGLSRLAVTYLLKDEFGLTPAETAALTAASFAPWSLKPVWGLLTDTVPLFGYRRKSYLVLCGVAGAAAWAAMANPLIVSSPRSALAATLIAAAATACADVVVDSLVVERSRDAPPGADGALQSVCWASAAVGGIVSAYSSGAAVAALGPRPVFAATACVPLLLIPAALAVAEQRCDGAGASGALTRARSATRALLSAASSRSVLVPALFVFAWQATPSPDSALFYYYTDALHLGPEFMGRVRLAGAAASLAGVALYNTYLKKLPLRPVFAGAAVIGAALASTQLLLVTGASRRLGIPDGAFVLADAAVLAALGQAAFMPVLVLAARLCPAGVEASLYALLMSVLNAGGAAGAAAGGALTSALHVGENGDWSALPTLVGTCVALSLVPLVLLPLVPDGKGEEGGEGVKKEL